jgi:hypothetical protein
LIANGEAVVLDAEGSTHVSRIKSRDSAKASTNRFRRPDHGADGASYSLFRVADDLADVIVAKGGAELTGGVA